MEQVTEKLPLQPGDSIHLDVVIMPEDSWKLYNNQDKIEPMLIMSYSCQEGEEGGYTREISWVTVIKVMPSLEFSNLELFEIERFVHVKNYEDFSNFSKKFNMLFEFLVN